MAECYFAKIFGCGSSAKELTNAGLNRITKIIESSKTRCDDLHVELQKNIDSDKSMTIQCHRDCVSSYTSSYHIQRHLKRIGGTRSSSEPPPKRRTRLSNVNVFDFQENCLFCGENCVMDPDPRNPSRWRKAVRCRTACRPGKQTFKDAILEVCNSRKDERAGAVEVRLHGAITDLHAADARYHDDCRKSFMSPRCIEFTTQKPGQSKDLALEAIMNEMQLDTSYVWTSIEIYNHYKGHGGTSLSRGKLIQQLTDVFHKELMVFASPGLANIIMFRSRASNLLRLVELEEEDRSIDTIAKQIVRESKEMCSDRKLYNVRMNKALATEEASYTLLALLSSLSDKLNHTLPAILIGNMITGILTSSPTSLQVALGVQTRDKNKIECLHDYGVTCSYDEVLRFKASAATAAANAECVNINLRSISDSSVGLIQSVGDNFDANISSQNGIRSTHALALLHTQQQKNVDDTDSSGSTVRRIRKDEMKKQVVSDVEVQRYRGPKKPDMPEGEGVRSVLPLKMLAEQVVMHRRAQVLDLDFLKSVVSVPKTPEFGGFNTRLAREQGQSLKPATLAMYTPLIDMVPSHPDTMMTAMSEAQRFTVQCGQTFTVFTADQQLYRVMINVIWVHPQLFPNFVPRLGGMHMLMSFVGCVGVLMANSGLEEVLKAAFGGVARMLTGKNFPQNVRGLRMVCEEVLRNIIQGVDSYEDMMLLLEGRAAQSRTTKLWVDCLIKPVLIMMLFVRAEREAEWSLHLYAVAAMMPYFFSAGHINYARYGLYYLRSMERLPEEVLAKFRDGEHVMRHKAGLWNAMWSDMYIETTFMRYGHGPGGLVGITLSPSTFKRWALSLHTCSRLLKDVADMRDVSSESIHISTHKEEAKARIQSDASDRLNIRQMLDNCVDPLNPEEHPDGILNIVSGRIGPDSVNVDNAVNTGKKQMVEYESGWPISFNGPLRNKVVTMAASKKGIKCGSGIVFDTELIYSRVMGLLSSRDIDLKALFGFELAPLPTSLFNNSGDLRIAKTKSTLKKKLKVDLSERTSMKPDVIIIDGCAILWCIYWPSHGTVQDYVDNCWGYVSQRMHKSHVYLVFDRYYEYSIKSCTRKSRIGKQSVSGHKLRLSTPLPAQHTILTVTENKVQLIDIICEQLQEKARNIPATDASFNHRLMITGSSQAPSEIHMGVLIVRNDLRTSHEEADVIIPQQVVYAASQGATTITVVCDDTDVFVLLLHYYNLKKITCSLLMQGTSAGRTVIDIAATWKKHSVIVSQLLAAHALSGCDTVAQPYGVGKASVIKMLEKGSTLEKIGETNVEIQDVIDEATSFVAACYGRKCDGSMSDVRYDVWLAKTGNKKATKTPQLRSLPPTSESFAENVKRAHIQLVIWKNALEQDPPSMDPTDFGWIKDKHSKSLIPVMIPEGVSPAPTEVLQIIRCGCASKEPCANAKCGCYAAQLSCTVFCNCQKTNSCQNIWTKDIPELSDDETNEDDDDG